MNKNITKKILIYTDDDLSKHKWLISLDNEFILKTLFKEYDKQPQLSNNTYIKGKTGEFFLENIFIKYDINYVKTCDKPHCGDFIINNKIMIDAKNYKNISDLTLKEGIYPSLQSLLSLIVLCLFLLGLLHCLLQ